MGIYLPNEDIQTAGWSTTSGTDFFAMVDETEGADDGDTTYLQTVAVNSALILGFQNPPPPDFGTQGQEIVVRHRVNVNATGNTALVGHSILNYGSLVTSTAVVITSTYSSLSIPLGSQLPTPNDYNGVQLKSQVLTAPQTGGVRITQEFLRMADPVIPALSYAKISEQEAINRILGNAEHEYSKEEALARALRIPGWFHGKYTYEELVAMAHGYSPSDPIAQEHNPISRLVETVAGINDFIAMTPGSHKYMTEQDFLSKKWAGNKVAAFVPVFPMPQIFSMTFDQSVPLSPNIGTFYTNAVSNSAFKDGGHEFHVGYSAGVFATASFANTLLEGALVGGNETHVLELRPYLASTAYTGQNTILELPGYLRIDYSGSGYNKFLATIADETNAYVSAIPSDAVTFGAGDLVHLALSYSYEGLDAKFYVNGVKSTPVTDDAFVGPAMPAVMFIGTNSALLANSASRSSFSGGIRSYRLLGYGRI